MSSVNEVTLMGNLGADPELRYTQAGKPVASLSLATGRKWTSANGEVHEETEWHRIVVWGPMAEALCKLKRKGDQLLVKGYLRTRSYEDRDGIRRYSTEIVAADWQRSNIVFTGRAPGGRPHPAEEPDSEPPSFRHPASRDDVAPPPVDGEIPF